MKGFKFLFAALAIAVVCVPVFSQINLNAFYSRGVSSGRSTCTKIDSVLVDSKAGNGVATTMLTLTLTPDIYRNCTYYTTYTDTFVVAKNDTAAINLIRKWAVGMYTYQNRPDTSKITIYTYTSGYRCAETGEVVDSVEISGSFYLPTDFVAKNLYLWVNGERQTGYIQDRALATQQYNQIVGKRRDPAILEFWGNGQYNLRIFPAKSLVSRKVAIEFQHTFNDDSLDLITAPLPFQYDSSNLYYSYSSGLKYPIGFMRVSARAADTRDYSLRVPGLGAGSYTMNSPLVLEGKSVGKVGSGTIQCTDPSGPNKFLWAALDKNKNATLGFSTMLSRSSVTLDPEPDTRIIVLDIRNETWNQNDYYAKQYQYAYPWTTYTPYNGYKTVDMMLRAKKSAVLCLQEYVAQNQKFNLILTKSGSQKPVTVFENPVLPTDENLAIAYQAVIDAKLSSSTSEEALAKALAQTPNGIVIFINDLYQPFNYGGYQDNTYSKYIVSDAGLQYDSLIARMSRTIAASSVWFFTIGDEYRLTQAANTSGGYNLASLRWDSYYHRVIYSVDGAQQTALQLPPLFGNYYYGQPITGLKVKASSNIGECVFTSDAYGYYYYDMAGARSMAGGAELMLDKKKSLSKASMLVAPYRYYIDSTMFRLAAKLTSLPYSGTIEFIITGKMGGLGFTKKVTADASTLNGPFDGQDQYGLWAFRKTEQLGMANWSQNADSIRWIGLDHHIVTRQTSLLALEPGMEIWKDTINPSNPSTTENKAGGASLDAALPASDISARDANSVSGNVDGFSLSDLIAKKAPVLDNAVAFKKSDMTLGFSKAGLRITVPQAMGGRQLSVSLYSLSGRLIVTRNIATKQGVAGSFTVQFGTKMAGKGLYLVKARIGSVEKVLSVPVF